jgi:hypothetical protein
LAEVLYFFLLREHVFLFVLEQMIRGLFSLGFLVCFGFEVGLLVLFICDEVRFTFDERCHG